ncbi:MAG: J domain-containing protein [Clostridiales bacterium]|nr:J domain-containing protein [Clostridiales bacterium]
MLGVDSKASEQEIKTAYRKAARKHHPDLHTKNEKAAAEEKFKEINEAYTAIGSPEKRAQYDQLVADMKSGRFRQPAGGAQGYSQYAGAAADGGGYARYTTEDMGGGSFSDFFESIFGRGGFGSAQQGPVRQAPARGQDLESDLSLTIREAYHGGTKTMQFSLRSVCPTCGGTGVLGQGLCPDCQGTGSKTTQKTLEVRIPPFVREGSKIRLKGQGAQGSAGGSQGDLLLTVRIQPDAGFAISGSNLETAVRITPQQAVLGDSVSVPTLDGTLMVTIPPMMHSGRKLRLRSKGWQDKDGLRGDLYVTVAIDIPATLDEGQLELYKRLAELEKEADRA